MLFQKEIKIPLERIPVLIGRGGSVKNKIEEQFHLEIEIDSREGNVIVKANNPLGDPYLALLYIDAIGKGFSPDKCKRLKEEDNTLGVVDLKIFSKTKGGLDRIKGRLIGANGIVRRSLEELTGTYISIYGHYASVIGPSQKIRITVDALSDIARGERHRAVYSRLEKLKSKEKLERFKIWSID